MGNILGGHKHAQHEARGGASAADAARQEANRLYQVGESRQQLGGRFGIWGAG